MKELIFKIDADGEITMEVKGAVGANCDEFSAPFESSLGITEKKERKAEYYQSEEEEKTHVDSQ